MVELKEVPSGSFLCDSLSYVLPDSYFRFFRTQKSVFARMRDQRGLVHGLDPPRHSGRRYLDGRFWHVAAVTPSPRARQLLEANRMRRPGSWLVSK
jgi:hypothetical protein